MEKSTYRKIVTCGTLTGFGILATDIPVGECKQITLFYRVYVTTGNYYHGVISIGCDGTDVDLIDNGSVNSSLDYAIQASVASGIISIIVSDVSIAGGAPAPTTDYEYSIIK